MVEVASNEAVEVTTTAEIVEVTSKEAVEVTSRETKVVGGVGMGLEAAAAVSAACLFKFS